MGGISGYFGSKAAKKAATAQEEALEKAIAAELEMYKQTREDQEPGRIAWGQALAELMGGPKYSPTKTEKRLVGYESIYGPATGGDRFDPDTGAYLGPAGAQQIVGTNPIYEDVTTGGDIIGSKGGLLQKGPGEFKESPYYNFLLEEGNKELARSQSARGVLDSGTAIREAQRYSKGLASTEYQNFVNNWLTTKVNPLLSVAGLGQVAVNATTNAATQTGANVANNYIRSGEATASGYINSANAITGGLSNMANTGMFYNYLNQNNPYSGAGKYNYGGYSGGMGGGSFGGSPTW